MSHWVAVEGDGRTLRVLCVRQSAGKLTIDHRFSVPLPEVEGEAHSTASVPATFFPRLAAVLGPALAERGIRRGELLVAMGRTGVELRTIDVPFVPDDELPELVRMQATQVFTPTASPSLVDFVPIDFGDQQITVLAASLPSEVYDGLKGLADALRLKLASVTLRTVSAARLLAYCGRHPGESLVICRSQEQVDLVAMLEGRPVFVRNTRIPGESIDAGLALEVRRTLLAIASRHSDEAVDRLVLWGTEDESGAIARHLRESLAMEVEVLDPFAAEDVETPGLPPVDDAGAYASLVGMLCEHRHARHAIDFQNPKRRVEPPKFSQRTLVYGGIAAAIALVFAGAFAWRLMSLNSEIAALQTDIGDLKLLQEKAGEIVERTDWVQAWTEEDYVWLDELRVVSERMPPAEKALVLEWSNSVAADGEGTINMALVVDEPETISEAVYRLRDEHREVGSGAASPEDRFPGYAYRTTASIKITEPVPPGEDGVSDAAAGRQRALGSPPVITAAGDDAEVEPVALEPQIGGSPTDLIEVGARDPVDAVEQMLDEEETEAAPAGTASAAPSTPDAAAPPAGTAPAAAPFEGSNAPASTPASAGAGK
jgi:Tfp pilus assembly PilM family ATPase